jgi:hypothetical protein
MIATTFHRKQGKQVQFQAANNPHRWRIATFAIAGLTSVAAAMSLAAPAQAADAVITLRCEDKTHSYKAFARLSGSGAPTAKYNVHISVYDTIDDTRAPKVRLRSINKDNSVTDYPWRTGDQGRAIRTYWDTTLQQPKGLKAIILEANVTKNGGDEQYFFCTDYAPKS